MSKSDMRRICDELMIKINEAGIEGRDNERTTNASFHLEVRRHNVH
jgi:hypothetical protein